MMSPFKNKNGSASPFNHGHRPGEGNPPELTKVLPLSQLALNLGELFPAGDDLIKPIKRKWHWSFVVLVLSCKFVLIVCWQVKNNILVLHQTNSCDARFLYLVASPASMRDWLSGNIPCPALLPEYNCDGDGFAVLITNSKWELHYFAACCPTYPHQGLADPPKTKDIGKHHVSEERTLITLMKMILTTSNMKRLVRAMEAFWWWPPHQLLCPVESFRGGEVDKAVAEERQAVRVWERAVLAPPLT